MSRLALDFKEITQERTCIEGVYAELISADDMTRWRVWVEGEYMRFLKKVNSVQALEALLLPVAYFEPLLSFLKITQWHLLW